jgi:hypothetical protein
MIDFLIKNTILLPCCQNQKNLVRLSKFPLKYSSFAKGYGGQAYHIAEAKAGLALRSFNEVGVCSSVVEHSPRTFQN